MKPFFHVICILGVGLSWLGGTAHSAVEWEAVRSISVEGQPLDVAMSADGRWSFVLVTGGKVLVYTAAGEPRGVLTLPGPAERIASSPRGDQLLVTRPGQKAVDVIAVEFVQDIEIGDSPFMGPADAPVTVTVFSDFQ